MVSMLLSRFGRSILALVAFAALTVVAAPPAAAEAPILGGGSSFAQSFHDQWAADLAGQSGLSINYAPNGSTQGRDSFRGGQYFFGASDTPYLIGEQKPSRNYIYVPVMAGGLAFMYNLRGANGQRIEDLRLDSTTVCRMFTEPGMRWNDAAIVTLNPTLALPADPVTPIKRGDSSGTSYVLSEFCITTNPDVWSKFIQTILSDPSVTDYEQPDFPQGQPISRWPGKGNAGIGSDGVSETVSQEFDGVNGKITYVEYGAAKIRKLPVAYMFNGGGQYVLPIEPAPETALKYAVPNKDGNGELDGTFDLVYAANDPAAYFPSTYSYVIAPVDEDLEQSKTLARYLQYAVTAGQEPATRLGYDPLSCVISELALRQTAKIKGAQEATSPCGGGVINATTPIQVEAVATDGPGAASPTQGVTPGGSPAADGTTQPGAAQDPTQAAADPVAANNPGGQGAPQADTQASNGATATTVTPGAEAGAATTLPGAATPGASPGVTAVPAAPSSPEEAAVSARASLGAASAGGQAGSALSANNQAPGVGRSNGGSNGPSNADVLWTLLAGAVLAGAGTLFATRQLGSSP